MFSPTVAMFLNLARMTFEVAKASGACAILLAVVLQSHLDCQLKQGRNHLAMLTVFEYLAVKQNSRGAVARLTTWLSLDSEQIANISLSTKYCLRA